MLPQIRPVLQRLIRNIDPDLRPRQPPQYRIPWRRPPRLGGPAPDPQQAPEAQEDAEVGDQVGEGAEGAAGAEEARGRGEREGCEKRFAGEEGGGCFGGEGVGGMGEVAGGEGVELGVEQDEGVVEGQERGVEAGGCGEDAVREGGVSC